jgi:hypothetical protein
MSARTQDQGASPALRWAVIAAIAGVAFFGSYRYALASSSIPATATASTGVTGTVTSVSGGGGCCGGRTAASTTGATSGTTSGTTGTTSGTGVAASGGTAAASSSGGGCCGGGAGANAPAVKKSATVSGGVQKISVDLSKGYYDPNTIQLKAGVPAEITFGQASGCTGIVQSQQLGFSEDLSAGPKTVKIAALQPGTYQFACGMSMVTGTIVVK